MSRTAARLGTGLFSVPQFQGLGWHHLQPPGGSKGQDLGKVPVAYTVLKFQELLPVEPLLCPIALFPNSHLKSAINGPGLRLGPQTKSTAETEAGGERKDPPK